MKISYDEVRTQIEQLPIGYYASRRIFIEMSIDEPTSFYSPSENKIVISYQIIAEGLANAEEEESYKETAIRSMLYHEVSHAILTNPELMSFGSCFYGISSEQGRALLNIFEDERIETLLQNFYMDTNFKKNLLYITGGIKEPKDVFQAFFNLVRFRSCPEKKFLDRVEEIIRKYPTTPDYYATRDYVWDINELWVDFKKWYNTNSPSYNTPSFKEEVAETEKIINSMGNSEGYDENNQNGEGTGEDANKGTNEENGEGSEEGNGEEGSEENGEGNGEGSGENGENGEETANGNTSEDGKGSENGKHTELSENLKRVRASLEGKGGNGACLSEEEVKNLFQSQANKYHDSQTTEKLQAIINTFNKKNNSGNGCTGYSGIFNPRNIKNNDYKFFDRKISANGNNKFNKFHLNLVIDKSGSFERLETQANTLISSLGEIERRNPNFTFDLILSGNRLEDTDKEHRFIVADGGNDLTYNQVKSVMDRHRKKDAYVYTIVLHDGECTYWKNDNNPFRAWNSSNVAIIDTGDNRRYIDEVVTSAKVIISPYKKLVETLTDEVVNILRVAFR